MFRELVKVWKHVTISIMKKLMYYDMYILSNLFYVFQTCWLIETELKSLDAAHYRFLRAIFGIAYSSVSRVSNGVVLAKAGRSPARFYR